MTKENRIRNSYYDWLIGIVDEHGILKRQYSKLMSHLYSTEFTWKLTRDKNRASDGIEMRLLFADEFGYDENYISDLLCEPCSILEMMVALSYRCEDTLMVDMFIGERFSRWFFSMLDSLGLRSQTNDIYDENIVNNILYRFLERKYKRNGEGGLYTVDCGKDLRKVDIWYQMNWYLCSLEEE